MCFSFFCANMKKYNYSAHNDVFLCIMIKESLLNNERKRWRS
ncbi:hypothetical protein BACPEC_01100 [[Bacteroides] pectinophilus ATCC 43243]|uniref:Uncharacterized protein n=1 Tax=[Bacteroides] pectinophilus ATCC 43243 TaxID=483218 RepID=B7AQZ0_9FIRM|nr:hypothetical protein BACPEC_01100 [[Bacteroides] pectinophilus ATCC 43243]